MIIKGLVVTLEDIDGSCILTDSKNGNIVAICDSKNGKRIFDISNSIGSYQFVKDMVVNEAFI